MAEPKERALPSLVADDLVDLVRRSLEGDDHPLAVEADLDGRGTVELPTIRTDGLAVAYPYAVLELLVEIRDALVPAGAPGILAKNEPIVSEVDLAELELHLGHALAELYLGGRTEPATKVAMTHFTRFLREAGLLP